MCVCVFIHVQPWRKYQKRNLDLKCITNELSACPLPLQHKNLMEVTTLLLAVWSDPSSENGVVTLRHIHNMDLRSKPGLQFLWSKANQGKSETQAPWGTTGLNRPSPPLISCRWFGPLTVKTSQIKVRRLLPLFLQIYSRTVSKEKQRLTKHKKTYKMLFYIMFFICLKI